MNEIALMREIAKLQDQINSLRTITKGWSYIPLVSPLTSTSWDGDSFSTTAKTLIDLSAVFGAPAGVKAVDMFVRCNDSGSAGTHCWLALAPVDTVNIGKFFNASAINDRQNYGSALIPCDANGDIYYQINASGASTFDVLMQIWGYFI